MVQLLSQTHLSVIVADVEGVTAALVLERVVNDGVAPAVHVFGFQLKMEETKCQKWKEGMEVIPLT